MGTDRTMNPTPRKTDDETKKLMDEYLKNGGKITQCEPFARTEDIQVKGGFYGRKKKKKETE